MDGKENQPKTASIRSRPISSRITTAELEELFQRQAELSPVYHEQVNLFGISKDHIKLVSDKFIAPADILL